MCALIALLAAVVASSVFIHLIRIIHKLQDRNQSLRKEREVIFEFIHQVGEGFANADDIDMDQLLKRILFYATNTAQASSGAIYLFNPNRSRLFARAVSGIMPPLYDAEKVRARNFMTTSQYLETVLKNRPIEAGEGLIGSAASVGNAVIIEDAEIDARIPKYDNEFLKIKSLLIIPMRFGSQVLGVMTLVNRIDNSFFTPSDLNLVQAMADQASVPIHYAGLRTTLEQKKQIDHDMQVAQQIQTSLLPQTLPEFENLQLTATNLPAFDIGGDYYDFIKIDETHLGVAIADVSGKGIGGAMMMSVCQGILRIRATQELSPSRMLSELNRVLSDNLAEDMFITMLYMVIDTENRTMTYARAGHEPPLLRRVATGGPEPLESPGMAIGLTDPDIFDQIIKDKTTQLKQGDIVVLYTDGITEAQNREGEEWGLERLERAIDAEAGRGVNQVAINIFEEIEQFVGIQPQYDDMTLVAMRIN
jgi:sigma-B regulation protein RsbU (phosphoserine phosphatase)